MAQLGVNGGEQRSAGFAKLGAGGFDIGQRFLHVAVAVQRDGYHFFEPRVVHHLLPLADDRRRLAVGAGQRGGHRRRRALVVRVKGDAACAQERDKKLT
nr:Uncharacterised protein [Raoultella sp. NCTC 9187]